MEKSLRVQAVRLLKVYEPTKEDLLTLKSEDFTI
ncbi:hypothetical protein [Brevibacillus parabrevis]